MAKIDGTWEIMTNTPMGEQTVILILVSDGDTFTGRSESALAMVELENGTIDGDSISWSMQITTPMRLTLEGRATIDGDTMTGTIKAGFMGSYAASGRRVA